MFSVLVVLLALGWHSEAASNVITFPTSFTPAEEHQLSLAEVRHRFQKGIGAVQSVAGLVQNLLLEEPINFATENWVISPVSLAGVFAQLLLGSRGEFREILTSALSLDDGWSFSKLEVHRQLGNLLQYLKHSRSDDYILLLDSVVFLQHGFPLKISYKHALMDFYNTKIIPVDFTGKSMDSLKKINEWVRNSTMGRFVDVIPAPLSPNTVSLMANVVYFKGAWEVPFDPHYTLPGMFFINNDRKVNVDYMYGEQEILYGNTSDFQLVGLPFKNREVVVYILLPNGKFSTRVALKKLDAIASSARLENVTLVLPKFKITTTISVRDAIAKYLRNKPVPVQKVSRRMKSSVTPQNDLKRQGKFRQGFDMSGASDDIRFRIDDILHKVSIQVDEKGTEIVGVTSTLIDHAGNDFIIKVNRPFLFFVRHERTLTHLFWGLVVNPSNGNPRSRQFGE